MTEQEIEITTGDGYLVKGILREPKASPKGVIQLQGGTGIPQDLYSNFVRFLVENGYVTLTYDYRGIGRSRPDSLKGFAASISDWARYDMPDALDWLTGNYPGLKTILIGHSMGGQLVGLMRNNRKLDQVFLIAASTGYWQDMGAPFRYFLPFLWYIFIPLSIKVNGYANAKKIRQGESLPAGVALEWRKWCTSPNYFADEFGKSIDEVYFDQLKAPITSIQLADDPIANDVTVSKLLEHYRHTQITRKKIYPHDLGVKKIGHAGFFSRKFKDNLWKNILKDLTPGDDDAERTQQRI